MIPPKVTLEGDTKKAGKLRGFALSQLRILHNAMKFQGLKQDVRMVRFSDGSWIKLVSNFGLDLITVFAPPVLVKEVGEELEWPKRYKFYLRVKIDGNDLFYGGQKFVVKYTDILGNEIERGDEDELVRTVPGNSERDDKGYTMNLVGPFVLDITQADFSKPVYVGLLKERDLTDIEFPDDTWITDEGCEYLVYPEGGKIRYYGLESMFSYLKKDNDYGTIRTYTQHKEENNVVGIYPFTDCLIAGNNEAGSRDWHIYVRGLTESDSIPDGEVSSDKYRFLETIYKEISWGDFASAKSEVHIVLDPDAEPGSEPKAEAVSVIDLDLAFGLKVHYTNDDYIHSDCPIADDAHLYSIPYPDRREIYTNCAECNDNLADDTSKGVVPNHKGDNVSRFAHVIAYQADTYEIEDATSWRSDTGWRHCLEDPIVGDPDNPCDPDGPCPDLEIYRLQDIYSCYDTQYKYSGQAYIEADEYGIILVERDADYGWLKNYRFWWLYQCHSGSYHCSSVLFACPITKYESILKGETRATPTYWF